MGGFTHFQMPDFTPLLIAIVCFIALYLCILAIKYLNRASTYRDLMKQQYCTYCGAPLDDGVEDVSLGFDAVTGREQYKRRTTRHCDWDEQPVWSQDHPRRHTYGVTSDWVPGSRDSIHKLAKDAEERIREWEEKTKAL